MSHAGVTRRDTKPFDEISVQDIAEAATVNRATFYDHYTDKYSLLEANIAPTRRTENRIHNRVINHIPIAVRDRAHLLGNHHPAKRQAPA